MTMTHPKTYERAELAFLLDFDGTVTVEDATELLLDSFARQEWNDLKRSSRDHFDGRSMLDLCSLFPTDKQTVMEFVLGSVSIRPGFVQFVEWARSKGFGLLIASGGFGFYIEELLRTEGVQGIRTYANDVLFGSINKPVWGLPNLSCDLCPTCKRLCVEELRAVNPQVAYVGDGLGDRYAAVHCDLIFARDCLEKFCSQNNIVYAPWDTFYDIMAKVEAGLESVSQTDLDLCPAVKN